jgi:hypothetical protein
MGATACPQIGADYRRAQERRKPGFQADSAAPTAMNSIPAPIGIA